MSKVTSLLSRGAYAILLVALLLVAGCGSTGADEDVPVSVAEAKRAFAARGIDLVPIVDVPAGSPDIDAVLGSSDSDQVVVTILDTIVAARNYFRAATGRDPDSEVTVDGDTVFLERNVVVVFDGSLTDYEPSAVRDALGELG